MRHVLTLAAALVICSTGASAAESASCAAHPITSGYGADGPYGIETQRLANPGDPADEMTIYFPKAAKGPRPVVFFAHGFGPGLTSTYTDIIQHIVSQGDIVVFSTYSMLGVTIEQRYDSLWQGFATAAEHYGSRMDLSRVAFVGHSFGGGAVPAMAYKGLVEKGWGRNGAFLMALAPWYAHQLTDAKLARLPAGAVQFIEVYDNDVVNDHRMGIDLYATGHSKDRFYVLVELDEACGFAADHATPGRNPAALQKQYAVSRPFDALADWVFNGRAAGHAALDGLDRPKVGYQPLRRPDPPQPDHPESFYRYPWTSAQNPRSGSR